MRYYIVHVFGCVESSLMGPYDSDEERDNRAKETGREQSEDDALFWLNVNENGVPEIGDYSGGFFEEEGREDS